MGESVSDWPPVPWKWPPTQWGGLLHFICSISRYVARQRGLSPGAAEDVAQEVALTVWRWPVDDPKVASAERLRTAIFRLADNHVRRVGRQEKKLSLEILVEPVDRPDRQPVELLDLIPEGQMKEAVRLKYLSDSTYQEVARNLGVSESTAFKLTQQGINAIRTRCGR